MQQKPVETRGGQIIAFYTVLFIWPQPYMLLWKVNWLASRYSAMFFLELDYSYITITSSDYSIECLNWRKTFCPFWKIYRITSRIRYMGNMLRREIAPPQCLICRDEITVTDISASCLKCNIHMHPSCEATYRGSKDYCKCPNCMTVGFITATYPRHRRVR